MRNKVSVAALAFIVAVMGSLAVADVMIPNTEIKSAPAAKGSHQWVPVDQDVWAVFLEAPEYHFAKARESLANKDAKTAAAEIREGAKLLRFQAKRLDAAVGDLYTLAKQVSAGKVTAGDKMDTVLANANKALDYHEPLVPVAEGDDELLMESGQYHIAQAKTKLSAKDKSGAAAEIRKAIAFVKIEAAHTGHEVSGEMKSALDDMEALAKKAESGADVGTKELDQAFSRALNALHKSKL